MEELLKKINANLIEIKSKQDRDTFHISGGTGNIGQKNNYFPISNPSVKIELKEPYKIYIFKLLKNEQVKDILFIAYLPLILLTIFISFYNDSPNLFKFLQMILESYIILAMVLFSLNYCKIIYYSYIEYKIDYKNYILIDKEKIEIIKEKETKIINFRDIRKIEIEKNYMIGYNILVYNKQLNATLTYNVHYREKALLVKELFEEYLLNKKIKPRNRANNKFR